MIFTILIAFMTTFGAPEMASLKATTPGQYVEIVNVQYDAQVDKTFGVLVRYNVNNDGSKVGNFLQLRNCSGKCTGSDIAKAVVADHYISVLGK